MGAIGIARHQRCRRGSAARSALLPRLERRDYRPKRFRPWGRGVSASLHVADTAVAGRHFLRGRRGGSGHGTRGVTRTIVGRLRQTAQLEAPRSLRLCSGSPFDARLSTVALTQITIAALGYLAEDG